MTDLALPLKRLRLELDRTVRTRDFFARAVTGRLAAREYHDLLQQLGWLIEALTRGSQPDLQALGRADSDRLASHDARALPRKPCPAVRLASEAARSDVVCVADLAADACVVVLGTSWTSDAGESLSHAFPGATRLLEELAGRSRGCLARLTERLREATHDAQSVYAFAELARGSLLGLATYLDVAWPPPELQLTFDRSHDVARAHA